MMAKACQKHDNRVIDQALSLILKKIQFSIPKSRCSRLRIDSNAIDKMDKKGSTFTILIDKLFFMAC